MTARRKLLLVALIAVFAVILLAGSAARPVTVRSDGVGIQTYCRCYWNGARQMWCYQCCDVYGCYNLYCDWDGC